MSIRSLARRTELKVKLSHRQMTKATGKQLLSMPETTALALDPITTPSLVQQREGTTMSQEISPSRHPIVAMSHFLSRFSVLSSHWTLTWGMIGVWIYFAGWVLPQPGNLPLIGLALCSTLAVATGSKSNSLGWTPLTLTVGAFLVATASSTWGSVDLGRSLRLSTPFLPAGLLFLVVASHEVETRDIRRF